jgi:hypothetical protein
MDDAPNDESKKAEAPEVVKKRKKKASDAKRHSKNKEMLINAGPTAVEAEKSRRRNVGRNELLEEEESVCDCHSRGTKSS